MLWGRHASRRSEARFPTLWDGRVFSVCPSIQGPSGLRLWDTSGRSNHGTLTNMDPATDWVRSAGQYALDFDGSNDVVTATSAVFALATPFTISVWYNPRTRKQYAGIVSTMTAFDETATSGWVLYDGAASVAGNVGVICGGTRVATGSGNSTLNAWQHYVGVVNGAASKIYKNGVLRTSGTTGTPSYAATPVVKIGSFIVGSGPNDALIDDIAVFNRELTPGEIRTLARRRGISYEMRRDVVEGSSGFQAAWARRQNQIIGGGV